MRNKLITFLKHFPFLHRFIQSLYWKLLSLKAHVFGTKVEEKRWSNQRLNEANDKFNDLNHPHRRLLIEKINKFQPFNSCLEIGCGYGPNLYLLAKKFPGIKLTGIDINPIFIQEGNKLFKKEGIYNIELINGKVDELVQFKDKSFDVVLTDAVLIYIGRDKIKKVVKEMIRITKHALILVEWHYDLQNKDPKGLGIYHLGCWKRNYVNLFSQFISKNKIQITKLLPEHWPDKNWEEFGHIIEARI